jgi:hypothetical protein
MKNAAGETDGLDLAARARRTAQAPDSDPPTSRPAGGGQALRVTHTGCHRRLRATAELQHATIREGRTGHRAAPRYPRIQPEGTATAQPHPLICARWPCPSRRRLAVPVETCSASHCKPRRQASGRGTLGGLHPSVPADAAGGSDRVRRARGAPSACQPSPAPPARAGWPVRRFAGGRARLPPATASRGGGRRGGERSAASVRPSHRLRAAPLMRRAVLVPLACRPRSVRMCHRDT